MTNSQNSNETLIHGIRLDEWISKTDEIAPEQEINTLNYEKKPVAFLDLLGITNEIRTKIKFRDFFEKSGFINLWKKHFRTLSENDKKLLLERLSEESTEFVDDKVISFYKIKKHQVETGKVNIADFQ